MVGLHLVDLFAESASGSPPPSGRRRATGAEPTLGEALQEALREHRRIHTPDFRLTTATAELYRQTMAVVAIRRRQATILGDVDDAWALLADAAVLESLAEQLV